MCNLSKTLKISTTSHSCFHAIDRLNQTWVDEPIVKNYPIVFPQHETCVRREWQSVKMSTLISLWIIQLSVSRSTKQLLFLSELLDLRIFFGKGGLRVETYFKLPEASNLFLLLGLMDFSKMYRIQVFWSNAPCNSAPAYCYFEIGNVYWLSSSLSIPLLITYSWTAYGANWTRTIHQHFIYTY